tara:strand:+ start:111 stop:818 length:708 start_codon:yes stop_codon:yes gene_type:complete
MARTNKPERKVLGSLTGEIWTTRSAKVPRRRLPDGRTETGREIPEGHPEFEGESKVEEAEEIEILIEMDEEESKLDDWKMNAQIIEDEEKLDGELEWKKAQMEWKPEPIPLDAEPEPEPIRGSQAPRTTAKDHDKIQDLFLGMAAVFDNHNYTAEDKVTIIAKLFEGTTDVRVETAQYVMSAKIYGLLALGVSVALLFKGSVSGGLFENYRKNMFGQVEQDPLEADPFGEEHGPN